MKASEVLKLNDEQFEKQLDLFDSIPKSKVLSKSEEFELRKSIIEYQYTLNKCADGRIVSAELQPIVNEFEAADYNIDNLRPAVKNSLQSTYEELKFAIESDPKSFKNTTAKLYCELYEMFKMNKASEAMKRMKNTKFFKSNKLSKESFSVESLEAFIAENGSVKSTEGFLDNFFTKLLHKSQVPAASISIQATMLLVSVLLLLTTIAVITLCVINAQYKAELVRILDKLSDEEIKNKGSLKCRQDNVKAAALNMEANTPAITKQTLIKAAKYSIRQINGFAKADYSELDKSVEEFNDYCNDIVVQSKEGVSDKVLEFTKPLYQKFIEFVTKWKTGIIAIGMIIGFIKVGIPLIRAAIYHFKSWRIKMSNFFEEQTDLTNANVEYLVEQRDDPSTSPMEKERLNKVIQRQRVWIKNMTAWANLFYKSEIDAGSDTMYEIRQDERVNFDEIASKQEQEESDSIDELNNVGTTVEEPNVEQTPSNKPVVLF